MMQKTAVPLAYFITFSCYGTWLHGGRETSKYVVHEQGLPMAVFENKKRVFNNETHLTDGY